MTKNLVRHITLSPEGLDEYEDQLGIERKRARIERRVVGAQDDVIKEMFTGRNLDILLSMTPIERIEWLELHGELRGTRVA